MTGSLRKTLDMVRVKTLKVITAVMAVILLMCMSTFDGDLRAWVPLFLISFGWTALVLYANGCLSCGDCRKKNRCMDRSRNYLCRDFKKKEDYDGIHDKDDSKTEDGVSEGADQQRIDQAG